jgi:GT2 family glycosyltransferase/predicted Zn-dependent protease
MSRRYLFGPVPRAFAEQKLLGPRQAGDCVTFHPDEGEGDVWLRPGDSWEDLLARLPPGWAPDLIVLWLPYATVPGCLWAAPLPRLGLAPDWNLLWHYYRRRLAACDWAATDTGGAELLNRAGLGHARPGNLCGCDRAFVEGPWPERTRDIDLLVVGNFNPAVQRERAPWLGRLARLAGRWNVVFRAGVFGESYRRLLARSRVVFHASARRKVGPRAFEAAAAGALVFQERGNRELPDYFRDRRECVYYGPDDAEQLLEYYLSHEEERRALAEAARARAATCRFEDFWPAVLGAAVPERPGENGQGRPPAAGQGPEELVTRCWQALQSSRFEDVALVADLEKAVRAEPKSAALHNALGVLLGRQAHNRGTWRAAAEVAAEHFRAALDRQPGYALAGLNLAEALAAAGQELAAAEAARRALEALQRSPDAGPDGPDDLPWGPNFDLFHVEWERAAWGNAGRPEAEARDKRVLLRWRLHTLLAQWTGELLHAYEAALLRPDLPTTRATLGAALLRANRPAEALEHLRPVVAGNPLDRPAARACSRALAALGDAEGQRQLAEGQRLLSRACPALAPAEAWFSPPRPKGDELASVLILCHNQLEYTRLCLESLLRHTRPPYELVLVDNGSTDATPEYLEEVRRRAGPHRVEVVRNETNLGFAAGCNQALARAAGRYVVFLNNDVVLTPGWLEGLVGRSLQDWPAVGLVGPVTNAAPDAQGVRPGYAELSGLDDFAARRRRDFAGKALPVNRLTGFCLLARREVLDRVGGLDERFGLGFFEDDDLGVRAREAGFRLLIALEVYVHHFGSRTFQALGVNTRERLEANFELFRGKWGPEYTAGYRLPPAPAEQGRTPEGEGAEPPAGETSGPAPAETEEAAARYSPPEAPCEGTQAVVSLAAGAEEVLVGAGLAAAAPAGQEVLTGVSLCMIVRDEEHHLPDCLRSAAGLFDDIVIVDTGSKDRTREVAREHGARVFDHPWPDSFGAARNESLRHARGKWVLWLDADDRLDEENRRKLRAVLSGLGDEPDAYAMKVRSVLDARRSAFRVLDQVRLFRNLPQVRWDYRIHEQILPAVNRAGGVVRWADVVIDHVGYVDPSARRRKLERNLRLLEMDHAERPDDAFTLFNLGWTLLDLGRAEEALTHLRRSVEKTSPSSSTLRKLYHLLALAHRHLGRRDEALASCREGLQRFPLDAEMLCEEGLLLRDGGDLRGAEASWLALLDARRGQYFASEEVGLRGFRTRQLVAEVYRAQERWVEAEVQWRAALGERPDFEPAWLGLSELYLRQERWSDLEYLQEKLEAGGVASPKLGWLRARGQVQRREWALARRTLAAVVAQDGEALGPRVLLSQVLLQEGRDWEAAERALRDVLALDPKHAETRHNLEVLLRRLGRTAAGATDAANGRPDKVAARRDPLLIPGR